MIPQPIDTIPLFQRLTEDERQLVTSRLKRRQVNPNELIITEGSTANTLYIITSGWVKLESGTTDKKITLANLGAGGLIGEVDLLQSRPYSMTAHAAGSTSTQLLSLSRSDLEDIINECPSIGLKFSANIGMRIAFLDNYLVQQRLRHIDLLSSLSESDLRAIAQRLDFRYVQRSEVIIDAGQPGQAAFFIEEGRVRLIAKTNDGESFEDLTQGTIFGHTALLTNKPYPATARAVTESTLWVLSRQAYQDLIREHPAVKLALSRALAEPLSAVDQSDAVERLRQLHLFTDAPNDALSMLTTRLVLRHFPTNESIYTEGTPGDAMYIVESGQVRLMDGSTDSAHLLERIRPGSAFGEMALLTGRTRAECARAAADTTVWVLYKSDFDDLLIQYPELSLSLSRALSERLTSHESDFVIRHMRRIHIFADLAGSELDEISKRVHGLRFRSGEIICFAGQPAQTLYLIEKGQIKRMTTGPAGEPMMLDILDAGDSFGDQEIVQNTAYLATAQTLTETELWTITKADFMAMMTTYPALALTVTRMMADRLSNVQAHSPMPPRPRPGMQAPPQRPPVNTQPSPRIQRPPSGARPIKPTAPVQPRPQPQVAPRPQQPAPRQQVAPRPQQPAVAPNVKKAVVASAVESSAPKPTSKRNVHTPAYQNSARGTPSFFSELGMWAHGLSTGAKLRVLTLGMLAVWIIVIAGPWTTVTAVSSAVGGLQLSNGVDTPPGANQASIIGSPFGNNRPKVAMAVSTNTPMPTRTPLPTFTPLPKPTLVPATRTRVPAAPVVAAVVPTAAPAIPALAPAIVDPRLVPGSGKDLPLVNGFKIVPASVGHGQKFWRVIRVDWFDISEAGNDHTIYVMIKDENGKRVDANVKAWGSGSGAMDQLDQKSAGDMCDCNYGIAMWGDGYGVSVDSQYPSEQATGMLMPMRRHVTYRVYFQLTTNP